MPPLALLPQLFSQSMFSIEDEELSSVSLPNPTSAGGVWLPDAEDGGPSSPDVAD